MRWIRIPLALLRGFFRRDVVASEIRDEMQFHLDMRSAEYEDDGLDATAAGRAARRRFGNVAMMQDRGYDVRGGGVMQTILQDVRFGLRLLSKQRAFSFVSILTLALGIGLSTALFSVIDAALVRPLPYPNPEELVDVSVLVSDGANETMQLGPSMGDLRTWREASSVFSHIGMGRVSGFRQPIVDVGTLDRLTVATVSEDFLEAYGVAPVLGRNIRLEDTNTGAPAVALLGHRYWQREFNGAPDVLGRIIHVANAPVAVVGVLPAGFYAETAVWTAMQFPTAMRDMRGSGTPVVGRLRPGVTVEQARRDLDAITAASTTLGPVPTAAHVVLESLYDSETSSYGATIRMLGYAVGLILAIACINVAGLLLARGATRQVELAIRTAIGAGRLRLVRQLLTETMVLALTGAALGIIFAWAALDSLVAIIPLSLPANSPATINATVLALTLALSLATTVVAGLLPAVRLSRAGGNPGLHLGGANERVRVPLSRRSGQLLVAAEVALALVLVAGSGLVVRSFARLSAVDLGFDPGRVMTMEVEPLDQTFAVRSAYYPALVSALRAMPEVAAAGAIDRLALTGGSSFSGLRLDDGGRFDGPQRMVLPGFFEALGVRPLAGRLLEEADGRPGEFGVVVNATAAARHFGDEAVGRSLTTSDNAPRRMRVVGVVPDIRHGNPSRAVRPEMYWMPSAEHRGTADTLDTLAIVVRPRDGARVPAERLRTAAEGLGARVLVGQIRPASDVAGEQVATPRQRTLLLGLLASSGLVLTLVGIFSTTAYTVTRRTREIGIRMAFGAHPAQVVLHIVRGIAWPVALGVVAGTIGAFYTTRVLESFLFQTTARDPVTFVVVILLVGTAACLAAWLPARRAAAVDPVRALRAE